jgi:hypothetical protein
LLSRIFAELRNIVARQALPITLNATLQRLNQEHAYIEEVGALCDRSNGNTIGREFLRALETPMNVHHVNHDEPKITRLIQIQIHRTLCHKKGNQ